MFDFDRNILCCITACNESEKELALLLSSFDKSSIPPYLRKRVQIHIILDKQRDDAPDTLTLIALKKLLNITSTGYYDSGYRFINGFYEDIPYYLYIKGDTLVTGKRYSILLFGDIVKDFAPPASTLVLFLDADTRTNGKSIQYLINELEKNPRCGGATGYLTVENNESNNIWVLIQEIYIYFIGNTIQKAADSLFNKCIVLPGAFSIVRYSAFVECLLEFSKLPKENDIDLINKLELGEDRYLTTLLIRKGYETKYLNKAFATTIVPDTLPSLITQQRRWIQSTWSNMIELLFGKKLKGFSAIQYYVLSTQFLSSLINLWTFSLVATHQVWDKSYNSWIGALIFWIYALILSLSFMNKPVNQISFWVKLNVAFFIILYNYNFVLLINNTMKLRPYLTSYLTLFFLVIVSSYFFIAKKYASTYIKNNRLFWGLIYYFILGVPMFAVIHLYAIANLDNKNWGTRGVQASNTTEKQIDNYFEQRVYIKGSLPWKLLKENGKSKFISGFQKKIIMMVLLFLIYLGLIKLTFISNFWVLFSILGILNLSNQVLTYIMSIFYHWKL